MREIEGKTIYKECLVVVQNIIVKHVFIRSNIGDLKGNTIDNAI